MHLSRLCAFPLLFILSSTGTLRSYSASPQPVHILPEPVSVTQTDGSFKLTTATRVCLLGIDAVAARVVRQCTGAPPTNDSSGGNIVIIRLAPVEGVSSPEGYLLEVTPGKIHITAPSASGLFYAFQTLRQLIPPAFASAPPRSPIPASSPSSSPASAVASRTSLQVLTGLSFGSLPCVRILDYPRFGWRGMHLDVSRHFFGVDFIKKYLDYLASFKLNTFHWHLTDSHGWRLEIKQYPRLTSVGAWRADRTNIPMTIAEPTAPGESASYGGFYTQKDIKEILAYAADRFITVIPEIEMPGHCTAALVAYPQYSDLDNPTPLLMPCGYAGDLLHNFCAGYDSTFVFLQNILTETMQLFPSQYIHIGDDEVREGPWLSCPRCRQRMKDKGFSSARQLQAWFIQRIDSFITANGRKMIGWDEIRNASMAPGSTVMSWHGDTEGRDSAGNPHKVVMTPYRYTYFDFYQSDPRLEPDITYAPLFLDSVYAFDPAPRGSNSATDASALPGSAGTGPAGSPGAMILGGQACLWTENVPTPARVEYMLLPRLLALSEALWTPTTKKNYPRFVAALPDQFKRFDAAGIRYAKSLYNPGIYPAFDSAQKAVKVRISSQAPPYPIRYTLDGSDPIATSALYSSALSIPKSTVLKTAVFNQNKRAGKINTDSFLIGKSTGLPVNLSTALGLKAEDLKAQDLKAQDPEFVTAIKRLTDGIQGTIEPYDGRWVFFSDSVLSFTIDLHKTTSLHSVAFRCMEDQVSNIYLPKNITISCSSDGKQFSPVANIHNGKVPQQLLRHIDRYEKKGLTVSARYIKISLANAQLWKEREKNLIFLDEILIN